MKVLLDEHIPHLLRNHLGSHEVFTVHYMGWDGLKNGELMTAAERLAFAALITGDQTMAQEQNLTDRSLALIVLSSIDGRS